MKQQHTPGPWKAYSEFIYDDNGKTIAEVCTYQSGKMPWEANARLMAAAPELLEVLKDLLEWSDGMDMGYIESSEKAEKLIAKIEEEENC